MLIDKNELLDIIRGNEGLTKWQKEYIPSKNQKTPYYLIAKNDNMYKKDNISVFVEEGTFYDDFYFIRNNTFSFLFAGIVEDKKNNMDLKSGLRPDFNKIYETLLKSYKKVFPCAWSAKEKKKSYLDLGCPTGIKHWKSQNQPKGPKNIVGRPT